MFPYCSLNLSNQKLEIKCITPDPVHTSSSFTRPHPVHTRSPRSHITTTITRSHVTTTFMTPFKHDQPVHTTTAWFTCDHPLHIRPSRSHDHIPFTRRHDHPIHTWPPHSHVATSHLFIRDQVVMVLRKCLDQYLSSCHIWTKSIKGFVNMRY